MARYEPAEDAVDTDWNDELGPVLERLAASADQLVAEQCRRVYLFDSYRAVPLEDVERSARRNVMRAISELGQRDASSTGVGEDEAETALRRALQGVPSADMMSAYRQGIAAIRDAVLDECTRADLPLAVSLEATRSLWQIADDYSLTFLEAQHSAELDLARRDEIQRIAFLGSLIQGSLTSEELISGGASYGLHTGSQYWVARLRNVDLELDEVSRHLETSAGPGSVSLIGPHSGDIVALLSSPPRSAPGNVTMGVAGPVALVEAPEAFRQASHVLEAALAFGEIGTFDEGRLSVLLAVHDERALGELFYDRWVATVERSSKMPSAVLDSVDAFLAHRRSIPETAHASSMHVNTLRYRLERYVAVTGADLNDTVCVFEIWWALRVRQMKKFSADQ